MIVYADTSALMKLVLDEPGTLNMQALGSRAEFMASAAIGYVELRSAVAAALREGRIPLSERERKTGLLEEVWERVTEIALDRPLLRGAGELAERMRLRGYDAIHLAALRQVGAPDDVTFACWDADLRRAAQELGYTLIPS